MKRALLVLLLPLLVAESFFDELGRAYRNFAFRPVLRRNLAAWKAHWRSD